MSNTYASLTEIKQYFMGQVGTTLVSDDALLTRLATAACDFFDNMVGRNILTASYTEYRNGIDEHAMYTYNYPITAVSSVQIDGVTIPLSTDSLTWGYVFDSNFIYMRTPRLQTWLSSWQGSFPITGFFLGQPETFRKGVQNVKIVYTAGYSTVPNDVKQAIIELVAFKYKGKDRIGTSSQSTGGVITSSYVITNIPKEVKAVIDMYRTVTVF